MKNLLRATYLLLPRPRGMVMYWLAALAAMTAVSLGLKITSSGAGQLWGLRLRGFGMGAATVVQDAYIEFMGHTWIVVWLVYGCVYALKPLVQSYEPDFERFLRHGRRGRLFIEAARILALTASLFCFVFPFAVAGLVGMLKPGLTLQQAALGTGSCASCIVLVGALVFFLASCGMGNDAARILGLAVPFLLAGISAFAERCEWWGAQYIPPGLPFFWDSRGARGIMSAFIPALALVGFWLVMTARTRSLGCHEPPVGLGQAAGTSPVRL